VADVVGEVRRREVPLLRLLEEGKTAGEGAAAPEVLDHRMFERVKAELGRCDVCGERKAVCRSREAHAKVCEVRWFAEPEHEHRRVRGCYARLVREWNGREGVR
jgi:hypothetical protein